MKYAIAEAREVSGVTYFRVEIMDGKSVTDEVYLSRPTDHLDFARVRDFNDLFEGAAELAGKPERGLTPIDRTNWDRGQPVSVPRVELSVP